MGLDTVRDVVGAWGTVGDAVGGLANGVTMIFVIVGFSWAKNEVHRNRTQHADEVRAAAAREIYRAVHAMLTDVLRYRGMTNVVTPAAKREALKSEIDLQMPVLRQAIADASLIFGDDLKTLIHRLVAAADLALAMSPHESLEKARTLDTELTEVRQALLDYLQPIATLSMKPPPRQLSRGSTSTST